MESGPSQLEGYVDQLNHIPPLLPQLTKHNAAQFKKRDANFPTVAAGILVPGVQPGSPAERAGLRAGDVIIGARAAGCRGGGLYAVVCCTPAELLLPANTPFSHTSRFQLAGFQSCAQTAPCRASNCARRCTVPCLTPRLWRPAAARGGDHPSIDPGAGAAHWQAAAAASGTPRGCRGHSDGCGSRSLRPTLSGSSAVVMPCCPCCGAPLRLRLLLCHGAPSAGVPGHVEQFACSGCPQKKKYLCISDIALLLLA